MVMVWIDTHVTGKILFSYLFRVCNVIKYLNGLVAFTTVHSFPLNSSLTVGLDRDDTSKALPSYCREARTCLLQYLCVEFILKYNSKISLSNIHIVDQRHEEATLPPPPQQQPPYGPGLYNYQPQPQPQMVYVVQQHAPQQSNKDDVFGALFV